MTVTGSHPVPGSNSATRTRTRPTGPPLVLGDPPTLVTRATAPKRGATPQPNDYRGTERAPRSRLEGHGSRQSRLACRAPVPPAGCGGPLHPGRATSVRPRPARLARPRRPRARRAGRPAGADAAVHRRPGASSPRAVGGGAAGPSGAAHRARPRGRARRRHLRHEGGGGPRVPPVGDRPHAGATGRDVREAARRKHRTARTGRCWVATRPTSSGRCTTARRASTAGSSDPSSRWSSRRRRWWPSSPSSSSPCRCRRSPRSCSSPSPPSS